VPLTVKLSALEAVEANDALIELVAKDDVVAF
jgi:hypothetical protein